MEGPRSRLHATRFRGRILIVGKWSPWHDGD
jgi:hypothetical protein